MKKLFPIVVLASMTFIAAAGFDSYASQPKEKDPATFVNEPILIAEVSQVTLIGGTYEVSNVSCQYFEILQYNYCMAPQAHLAITVDPSPPLLVAFMPAYMKDNFINTQPYKSYHVTSYKKDLPAKHVRKYFGVENTVLRC